MNWFLLFFLKYINLDCIIKNLNKLIESNNSKFDIAPGDWMVSGWIKVSWVWEFTVVIFGVHFRLWGFANLNEVLKSLEVGEVLVQVILHMLDKVHMVLDEVVSSNSWESKGIVIKLPGMNIDSWVLSFFVKLSVDLNGIIVMLSIKVSWEEVQFNI